MTLKFRFFLATLAVAFIAGTGLTSSSDTKADDHKIKVGVILCFTGPIESLTPGMAASAELAMMEVSDPEKNAEKANNKINIIIYNIF